MSACICSAYSLDLRGVPLDESLRESGLHGEGHELLLRPVVDVPFELAALLVLRGHQSLAGRMELVESFQERLGQSHVPKHQSGLTSEVLDEPIPRSR